LIRNPRWARYWPDAAVVRLATLGGLGRLKAPGTWGSLAGVLFYAVFFYRMGDLFALVFMAGVCYAAIGICGEAEKRLKKVDPGEIALDEFVAMPLCFIGLRPFLGQDYSWAVFLAAFGLFRLLDIWKPFGIRNLQRYYGGFGVVADDVAAALATSAILNAALRLAL